MPKRLSLPYNEALWAATKPAPTNWPPERTAEQRPKQRRVFQCAYRYFDGLGRERFEHVRNRLEPALPGKTKDFTYRFHPRVKASSGSNRTYRVRDWEWVNQFPPNAKDLVYRLPELVDGLWSDDPVVYLAEGEKDADALADRGYVASSHHGAGKFSEAQAHWFEGASRVVICMDRDLAGVRKAWDAYQVFRGVGFATEQISIVCAAGPVEINDVSDHLEAGYRVDQLVPVDPRWVRRTAATTATAKASARYSRSAP
jgi:hypothetical protein